MPYADPEKRKQYNTQYKQRWRKAKRGNQPLKEVRIFICTKWPSLNLGLAYFEGGFLATSSNDVIEKVLQDPAYMRFIFPISVDWDLVPAPMAEEDE